MKLHFTKLQLSRECTSNAPDMSASVHRSYEFPQWPLSWLLWCSDLSYMPIDHFIERLDRISTRRRRSK